ncbi:MAG: flavodoxin family protein [Candidatus Bipolaricaulis sp.]|nr:flavodoxin family protein [Candidatus Bipolaricaulis sp.]
MRVFGIVGSMRSNRHTATLVREVVEAMEDATSPLEAEIVHAAERTFAPCRVTCSPYCSSHPYRCATTDDVGTVLKRMIEADAVILGAPQYFRAPPAHFHAFIERVQSMFFFHETVGAARTPSPLAGIPCGLVAVAEYSNPHGILEYLHDFSTLVGMRPVLLDGFPYLGVGAHGDPREDEVFRPHERAKELGAALARAAAARREGRGA